MVISDWKYNDSHSQQRDKRGESSRDNDNLFGFFAFGLIPNSINHNQRTDDQIPAWINKTNKN